MFALTCHKRRVFSCLLMPTKCQLRQLQTAYSNFPASHSTSCTMHMALYPIQSAIMRLTEPRINNWHVKSLWWACLLILNPYYPLQHHFIIWYGIQVYIYIYPSTTAYNLQVRVFWLCHHEKVQWVLKHSMLLQPTTNLLLQCANYSSFKKCLKTYISLWLVNTGVSNHFPLGDSQTAPQIQITLQHCMH